MSSLYTRKCSDGCPPKCVHGGQAVVSRMKIPMCIIPMPPWVSPSLNDILMHLYNLNHLDFSQQQAHVGYREGACEPSFSNVHMSDFFCNTRTVSMKPMYQENVTNHIPWEPMPNTSGRQLLKHKTDNVVRNATCTAQNEAPPRFQGLESLDPVFRVAVLSLVAVIIVGSRFIWARCALWFTTVILACHTVQQPAESI
jgi:hypothetical protein